jgi:hypothetical protein
MTEVTVRTRSGCGGKAGLVVWTLFGLVFLVAGVVATWATARMVWENQSVRFWEESTCTITTSSVGVGLAGESGDVAEGRQLGFNVSYTYRAGGAQQRGHRVRPRIDDDPEDPEEAYRLAAVYPVGAEVPCRVDPDDPTAAFLEPASLWQPFIVLLPLIFVVVGAFILSVQLPKRQRDAAVARVQAITSRDRKPGQGAGCLALFFFVFFAAGAAFFVPLFAVPAWHALDSLTWPSATATVLESGVESHSSDDGTTYSVEVLFSYEVDGRTYHSQRYDFVTGSSSGYDGKRAIVDRIPPGTVTECYHDPDEPWRAVLSRDFRADWLFALIPLLFMAVGGIGTVASLVGGRRTRRRARAVGNEWLPAVKTAERLDERAPGGALVLEPAAGPWTKVVGLIAVAAFWNGIVGVFVWQWWKSYRADAVDGCLTLFLIPFVLIGLLLVVSVPYQILAAFNPRPILSFDRRRIEIGDAVNLSWRFHGSASRISRLTITVTGREEASYRRGTDRVTDKETFAELVLVDTGHGVGRGNARFDVPADTMHSFEAPSNKIVWRLKLHGVIANWPDVMEEFPLVIHPRNVR